ncbi:MAG: type 4a pilus biogenesis protein PilO [Steroidobacteraceae bacterium]|jgi:type IV pilus assembly protein PilO|nr:type 4a pilus biogenesis protein PilO [Steroidobacteraceae bacterium]
MNVLQELQQLDPRDPGRWPLPVRAGAAALFFVVLALLLGYLLVWKDKDPQLDQKVAEENQLRETFRSKHLKAVNLEIYEQQLKDIERSFGALLRQLPGKTEVPSLLVDISQTGLAAGLEEKLFQPENEVKRDFYAELPIKIRLSGSYHDFGEFVSGIAALPRIVTLHNIEIKTDKGAYDQLTLDLVARTYRYLDDEEIAAVENERRKKEKKSKKRGGGKAAET